MRIALLIPAGFLIGSILARAALAHHPHWIAPDLDQPLPVVTYWKAFGATMFGALMAAIAIGIVGYVAVLRSPQSPKDEPGTGLRRVGMTAIVSVLSCTAAFTFPVVFSSDIYAYAGYGDLALHGMNPYAHAHITAHEPLLNAFVWQWGNPPPMCVYGPAFVWIARGIVALLLPLGAAAPLWGMRVLASAALVACAPLAYAAFGRFGERTRSAAAAGIALNPLAIWNASSGHNDVLALAAVLAGFVLIERSRVFAGATVVALGALVKAPALGASAGMLFCYGYDRSRFVKMLAGTLAGTLFMLAMSLPLEMGVRTELLPSGKYAPQFSPQFLLTALMPIAIAAVTIAVLAFALTAFGVRRLLKHDAAAAVFVALVIWCAVPNPYPWYAVWILPVAFIAWETPAAWTALASTLLIGLRFYPEATWKTFPLLSGVALTLAVFSPAIAFIVAYTLRLARPVRREVRTTAPDFAPLRSG